MRKRVYVILTALTVALVGCVTINVYFPEAAAQKAADQFIGKVLDQAAPAAPAPTPKTPPVLSHTGSVSASGFAPAVARTRYGFSVSRQSVPGGSQRK